MEQLVKITDAAEQLGIHYQTLRRWYVMGVAPDVFSHQETGCVLGNLICATGQTVWIRLNRRHLNPASEYLKIP